MNLGWEVLLARLTDELIAKDKLTSARWQAAFRATPRHVFVPEYFEQDNAGTWHRVVVDDEMLTTIYRNVGLFTDVDDDGRGVSSSSTPGLMTRMLELLDVRDDDTVLEIGTGTGYNTALLCAGLGAERVSSIDVDYIETARKRLASLGYYPTLRTGDGINGIPDRAPFDRVLATVAVTRIPQAWLDQLADGGAVLADIKLNAMAGNLVLLHKRGNIAEGRFDTGQAWFMDMRHPNRSRPPAIPAADRATQRRTSLAAVVWEQPVPWFMACLELGTSVGIGYRLNDEFQPVAARLSARDGSWSETAITDSSPRIVMQAGPTRLWDAIERAFLVWETNGRPSWDRLGLTVTADDQRVWLDHPDGPTLGYLPTRAGGADS
ncbi:protein-L-isoaspartate(D-aspartate) O-methyltransferase [Tamaricihabitans halophyticus]|uniref:Protein-L-isoaspartate O-methyltransferase n=1 Tax=Tamaricihabitans halophyticus TaxID=1262583 RepID=A0A4R2Q3R4_9PSEU|nr:protein-L-isoaspartate carboxylmethyltransferase [Tamaricihabitans halophyticus]TCP43403.1 protein-L-isoaspartate(D-aspartate) O-methyltransferase [Tamaricihabitans halophyticus]